MFLISQRSRGFLFAYNVSNIRWDPPLWAYRIGRLLKASRKLFDCHTKIPLTGTLVHSKHIPPDVTSSWFERCSENDYSSRIPTEHEGRNQRSGTPTSARYAYRHRNGTMNQLATVDLFLRYFPHRSLIKLKWEGFGSLIPFIISPVPHLRW